MGKKPSEESPKAAKKPKLEKPEKKSPKTKIQAGPSNHVVASIENAEASVKLAEEIPITEDVEIFDENDCVDIEYADDASESTITTSTTTLATLSSSQSPPKGLGKSGGIKKPSSKQSSSNVPTTPTSVKDASKKGKRRRDSGTSSEEERWLTAIESGKLDDVDDELKKIKDPKLMTARQRAMYERNLGDKEPQSEFYASAEALMSLPIGYREREKPQTAEDIQKAALKSQKRKQQADEKREKDKKKTMERLLKKQESNKQRASAARSKAAAARAATTAMMRYRSTSSGSYIQLPVDVEFPLKAQKSHKPPPKQLCGIAGCGQPKVYSCSKTNMPLCSLACYRKNVDSVKGIIC